MKKLFATLATLSFLNACSIDTVDSNQVSSQVIHQSYSSTFKEDSNDTFLHAEFRVGGPTGTTVKLQAPSVVRYQGKELSSQNFLGTSYSMNLAGAFSASQEWEYINQDGKSFRNRVMLNSVQVTNVPRKIRRTENFEIGVKFSDWHQDDNLGVFISSQNGTSTSKFFSNPASTLTFSPDDLKDLNVGEGKVRVQRTRQSRLQEATQEGGTISATYEVKPFSVVIE